MVVLETPAKDKGIRCFFILKDKASGFKPGQPAVIAGQVNEGQTGGGDLTVGQCKPGK